MSDAFIGEIRLFTGNYAPENWHICDGSLLNINQYSTLYAVIGTVYGGNGTTTFGIPQLQGVVPIHQGQGVGLSPRSMGQTGGATAVALSTANLPAHSHTFSATTNAATSASLNPNSTLAAVQPAANGDKRAFYLPGTGTTGTLAPFTLATGAVGPVGGSQPHPNVMPTFTLNYIIALNGIFPQQS